MTMPKPPKHALPASERKLLFGECTNHTQVESEDVVAMDLSLVDLSMRSVEPDVQKPPVKPAPATRKTPVKTRSTTRAAATAKRRAPQKRVEVIVP